MYRLLEITYTNDKETVALYPTEGQEPFADEIALTAEFDTKMGAAMKSEAYKAELLVAFDSTGKIYAQRYHSKDDTVALSPRLIWITVNNLEETANQTKENSLDTLWGDMYSKRGTAKKNADVSSIMLMGIDGKEVVFDDYWVRPVEPAPEPVEE